MTMSDTVRSVRTQEIFQYDGYPVTFVMFEVFGFGKPMEHDAIMAMPGVQSNTWGPPIRMIADRLGVELDEIRETYEKVITPERLEVAAGVIEAGTVGAVRFETIGVVNGRGVAVGGARRHLPDHGRGQSRSHVRAHRRSAGDGQRRRDGRHDHAAGERHPLRV
jgi:hypothetical protein